MPALFRRPWFVLLLSAVAVAAVVVAVALARSRPTGCDVPAPSVDLPAQLRTLGGFDQPFDAADQRSLEDAAVTAATAEHADLAGATAAAPVREAADGPARYDALVVPLSVPAGDGGSRVAGVVAWLLDCSGRAWYDDVRDVLRSDTNLTVTRYPLVSAQDAAQRLGASSAPRLVWRTSPFSPLWLDAASGRSVAAGLP